MSIVIEPLDSQKSPGFAGRVTGVDLHQKLSPADVAAIEAGMETYGVLVFPDQDLGDREVVDFSSNFGELEKPVSDLYRADKGKIQLLSNADESGRPLDREDPRRLLILASRFWHTDSSFRTSVAKYTLLSARALPSKGGETEFADMRIAYETLSDEMKETVDGIVCEHGITFCRSLLGMYTPFESERDRSEGGEVRRHLVRTQQSSGRKCLYFGVHAGKIMGWPEADARLFLLDLTEHATQRQFVYQHVWRKGDLVMWDNRITLHRARAYDHTQVREFSRATVVARDGEFEPPLH